MNQWSDPATTVLDVTADRATEWAAFALMIAMALVVVIVWSRRNRLVSWPGLAALCTGMALIAFRIYVGRRLDLPPSWWGVAIWAVGLLFVWGGVVMIWWRRPVRDGMDDRGRSMSRLER